MSDAVSKNAGKQKANRIVAAVCLSFFVGMIGMAYAAVPLYKMFCQVTGYGGTTQRAEKQYAGKVLDREITIRFDANADGIPWDFQPVKRSMTIKIGETAQAHYTATNRFDAPVTGRASFNVAPERAGAYFNKVECFCFTDQTLKAGEKQDLTVVFYVDPALAKDAEQDGLTSITLSYTFYPARDPQRGVVENRPASG
jgi:cytochrome c oxidase assembly protein subunit 11